MSRTINPQEFKSLQGSNDVTVIDVRRKDDYAADNSAIPGSTWMDPTQIDNWCATLPADKEVVLYCVRGGAVSNSVVDTLQSKGLKARFIEGGITAWKDAGGKVEPK
jgi:rhodanese-related sulfurtransferase